MIKPQESEDSSSDKNNSDKVASNEQVDLFFETPVIGSYQDSILPDIPEFPDMIKPQEMDLKPEEEELHRHVGFVIKLNSRLLALHAEVRQVYPQLAKDLVNTKLAEFQDEEYKELMEEKVSLEHKCKEYQEQIQMLLPAQSLNNDLNADISKLRALVSSYSAKQSQPQRDYREMISKQSREYVNEIEKQLKIYREKVIFLSNNQESCLSEIKKSIQHQQSTQESVSSAYKELKPLQEHLSFLEETQNESLEQMARIKQEYQQYKERENKRLKEAEFKAKTLGNELDILKAQQKSAASEKIANKAQIEEHIEYKYKSQVQKLEEALSKMKIDHLTMEDDFAQRQKQEQERADKYRAKYESVKQHVKTLEMQKTEYTRVNNELQGQNNSFRTMITQLQNQLKMISIQQQQGQGQQAQLPQQQVQKGHAAPPPRNGQQQQQAQQAMKQRLMHLQQQQNMIQQQNRMRQAQQQQQPQNGQNFNRMPNQNANANGNYQQNL